MAAGPDGELPEVLQKLEPAILELVCNEIVEAGGRVQWDEIAGQDQAKRLVQELVVWPMLNPHLFKVALLVPVHACICVYMLDCVSRTLQSAGHQPGSAVCVLPWQQLVIFFSFGNIASLGVLLSWLSVQLERQYTPDFVPSTG